MAGDEPALHITQFGILLDASLPLWLLKPGTPEATVGEPAPGRRGEKGGHKPLDRR